MGEGNGVFNGSQRAWDRIGGRKKIDMEQTKQHGWSSKVVLWNRRKLKLLLFMLLLALGCCLFSFIITVPRLFDADLLMSDSFVGQDDMLKLEGRKASPAQKPTSEVSSHSMNRRKEKLELHAQYRTRQVIPQAWKFRNLLRRNSKETSFVIKKSLNHGNASRQWRGVSLELEKEAKRAKNLGKAVWEDLMATFLSRTGQENRTLRTAQECPSARTLWGEEIEKLGGLMLLPCGMKSGSSLTIIGKPRQGYWTEVKGKQVHVSHFLVELRALKELDGEDPPRILHLNPRVHGDWSGKPIIELNTCYRGRWAKSQRCDGHKAIEEVDGLPKCEEWSRVDEKNEANGLSWLKTLLNPPKYSDTLWEFPFSDERTFVLTIGSGLEGYHMLVDGKHVASFSYREDFTLDEATGVYIGGDVDLYLAVATNLPSTYVNSSSSHILEKSAHLKTPAIQESAIVVIGVISSSSHFAERMAIRKTWMRSSSVLSSNVVVRFFVGLHTNKEINLQLKDEEEFYKDIVILPFIDQYELVVLKTIAICKYGIENTSAKYIMKCDDDAFVRVEAILKLLHGASYESGLYMGNINQYHRPIRKGKWAVTYEEWPEEEYPLYADGPGYIISADVARFITWKNQNNTLRLFKMEDVSMGLWVAEYGNSHDLYYVHSSYFCQGGCVKDYYVAHYQSPHQMICMWKKLLAGAADCCETL